MMASKITKDLTDQTVASIADLTTQALESEVTILPGGIEGMIRAGNVYERFELPAPLRRERLATPGDLRDFVDDVLLVEPGSKPPNPGLAPTINGRVDLPAVFYDIEAIQFVYSLNDVRTFAVCDLPASEVWTLLQSIHTARYNQVNFVDLLRITLRGCLGDGGTLLGLVRKVRFEMGQVNQGVVDHTRQSMGKSIETQAAGYENFPEEVTLSVQVFDNFISRVSVVCALKVNPADSTFQMIPYPLELRKAMDETLGAIRSLFKGAECPVFRGKPSPFSDPGRK